ncbi:SDR family oxidoreductase [Actinomadura macrotermitis]|uniref:NAD(P)H azoreductase n=1 Tax=Actinomadura macrotermitis TaxID=2585200 RepID=A0A7K0BVD5_9ACTN|nr:NAD(P)H-binding protein [Actinomadura macrotermitis]MQY04852.1 NAD(P)H azoreductase [Actinomadura macrotermitis]
MIVVTGATGNVGRTLVRTLAEAGEQVTAVARRITQDDVPAGVRAVAADLADPAGLRPALDGARALFLLVAGEDPEGIVAAARESGVTKVVLLSSQGVGTRPEAYRHPARFEAAVAGSGLDWTVLRSGGLASNAFAWAEPIRAHRTAAAPFADVALPFVDPDDVAAAAAVVLREDGHKGATYVLNGPVATTPRERAAAIADAIGEPVAFVEQTRQEAHDQMAQFMPLPVVEGTLSILGEPTDEERRVSPHLADLLGRSATPFADWARRNAPAFR